ncbi:hypothetical protein TYRP_017767 [Tyrophagus putrescentiae]|nr:hypothetical protein TYRP_017767 [Tyrophagus putrescentiae]
MQTLIHELFKILTHVPYVETSVKTKVNVSEVFLDLMRDIHKIKMTSQSEQSSGCLCFSW